MSTFHPVLHVSSPIPHQETSTIREICRARSEPVSAKDEHVSIHLISSLHSPLFEFRLQLNITHEHSKRSGANIAALSDKNEQRPRT